MRTFYRSLAIGAMLVIAAPVFANEAHHATDSAGGSPPAAAEKVDAAGTGSAMPMTIGAASDSMMSNGMMSDGMMKMMMDMMAGGDGAWGQIMSPDRIEGRIAFLSAELRLTGAQRPLWDAVAEALRANARSAKDMMAGMPGGMMSADSAATPVASIELHERMLSARLEGLRRLKAVLEPFYASLDDAQKAVADKLLMPAPMGMM